jgi:hypothetical protein
MSYSKEISALLALGFLSACATLPKDVPVPLPLAPLPVAFQASPLFNRADLNAFSWKAPVGRPPFPHLRLTMLPTQNSRNSDIFIAQVLKWLSKHEGPLSGEMAPGTTFSQIQELFKDNFEAASQNLEGADVQADIDWTVTIPVLEGRYEQNEVKQSLVVAFMTPEGKQIEKIKVHASESMGAKDCDRYVSLAHEEGFPASQTQCFERGFLVALSDLLGHLESSLIHSKALGLYQSQLTAHEAAQEPIPANIFNSQNAGENAKPVPVSSTSSLKSDVDSPTYALSAAQDNYAVVVGIQKYENVSDAEFAVNDARAMRRHLLALGFPDQNITFLTDSQATKSGIDKYVAGWLPDHASKKSKIFFYFSGHGANDPVSHQAYLVPWDGDPSFLSATGYSISHLYRQLNKIKAGRLIVVLDSCFSGEGPRSVMAKGLRPLVQQVDMGPASLGEIAGLAAAGPEQIEGVIPEEGHGILTYYLLKGLNRSQGVGKLNEIYHYIEPRVEDVARSEGRVQTPQLMGKNTLITLGGVLK